MAALLFLSARWSGAYLIARPITSDQRVARGIYSTVSPVTSMLRECGARATVEGVWCEGHGWKQYTCPCDQNRTLFVLFSKS